MGSTRVARDFFLNIIYRFSVTFTELFTAFYRVFLGFLSKKKTQFYCSFFISSELAVLGFYDGALVFYRVLLGFINPKQV